MTKKHMEMDCPKVRNPKFPSRSTSPKSCIAMIVLMNRKRRNRKSIGQTRDTLDCMSCTTCTTWCHRLLTRDMRSTRKARPSFKRRRTDAEELELLLQARLTVLMMTTKRSMTAMALRPYSSISPGPSTTSLNTVSTRKMTVKTTLVVWMLRRTWSGCPKLSHAIMSTLPTITRFMHWLKTEKSSPAVARSFVLQAAVAADPALDVLEPPVDDVLRRRADPLLARVRRSPPLPRR